MKLTKSKLKQIIEEETSKILTEGGMQNNPDLGHHSRGYERERAWIASYINAWFNQRATGSGGSLAALLRKGARGDPGNPWTAEVSFNKALREDSVIAPEDVDHFANALENLANAIEADNTLVDPKIIGKKGDWYKYAQGI